MDAQHAKERACILAAMRGFALFSRNHQVFAVGGDGRPRLVCGSRAPVNLWPRVYQVLLHEEEALRVWPRTTFRLAAPSGAYEASSWLRLLWNWLWGRRVRLTDLGDGGGPHA